MLIIIGDFNTKAGREECRHKVSGKHSLHEYSNEDGSFFGPVCYKKEFLHQEYNIPT
jgi:endonuclease/exonuclease/phosphatase family metal-dependent hydrolase